MYDELYTLGLDELLERDISSYELFVSLPVSVRRKLRRMDIASFQELKNNIK